MMAQRIFRLGLVALALASASCGSVVRQGTGTSFLIVDRLEFARGRRAGHASSATLHSDVDTLADVPTISTISAASTFSLGLKDPGPAARPTTPTPESVHHHRPLSRAVLPRRRPEHPGRRRAVRVRRRLHRHRRCRDGAEPPSTSFATTPSARRRWRRWAPTGSSSRSSPRSRSTAAIRPAMKSQLTAAGIDRLRQLRRSAE